MRIIMTTTLPADAPRLACTLLEERAIACCNILPATTSMYWWQDAITTETEALLLMKVPTERVEAVMQRVRELHPYDLPEILSLPISHASEAYVRWVNESCRATLED